MFNDRKDAGRKLALKIKKSLKYNDYNIVAIVRGGVVVGKAVANSLKAKLSIIIIRKIGAPNNQELAIGAVGSGGIIYWDDDLIERLNIKSRYKLQIKDEKFEEIKKLEKIFNTKKGLDLKDKRVIIVDDGVATGATVICAQKVVKRHKPKEIVLAVPVISEESLESIKKYFDKVIVLKIAKDFSAVGQFYKSFPQVKNGIVIKTLSNQ